MIKFERDKYIFRILMPLLYSNIISGLLLWLCTVYYIKKMWEISSLYGPVTNKWSEMVCLNVRN